MSVMFMPECSVRYSNSQALSWLILRTSSDSKSCSSMASNLGHFAWLVSRESSSTGIVCTGIGCQASCLFHT